MGLLDDAIREHLELKRRLGADPDEVARLEREAFGSKDAPAASAPAEPEAPPTHPESAHEPVAAAAPEPPAQHAGAPEPAPPEPVADEPAPDHVDQPTRQFTLEELEDAGDVAPAPPAPAADAAEEHDELEETPDFLQETP